MTAWFANLRIGAKSALAPALAILGLIGVAAGSVAVFERLTQDFRSLNETSFVRFADATELDRAVLRVNAELYAIGSLASNSSEKTQVEARVAALLQRIDTLLRSTSATTGLESGADKAIVA